MATPDWTPSLEQVAAYVPSRTRRNDGTQEEGTFTDRTRPTAGAVAELADQAASKVLAAVGGYVPERLEDAALAVAAVLAASQIELRYFPDQLDADRSPYDALKAQYGEDLAWLTSEVHGSPSEDTSLTGGMPAYGFPAVGAPASGIQW